MSVVGMLRQLTLNATRRNGNNRIQSHVGGTLAKQDREALDFLETVYGAWSCTGIQDRIEHQLLLSGCRNNTQTNGPIPKMVSETGPSRSLTVTCYGVALGLDSQRISRMSVATELLVYVLMGVGAAMIIVFLTLRRK